MSGWKNERFELDEFGQWIGFHVDRKYSPHPGWGDRKPPSASDREMWDYYKVVYPGFAVDVFYQGAMIGTFKISDANSPIYYDKLGTSQLWQLLAVFFAGVGHGVGSALWTLEGTPVCGHGKLLIPYDGGITTVAGTVAERRVFP